VANLDRSIDFYRDAIGLELTGAPGPHVFSANAVVSSLYDAPDAQSRVASFRIPMSEMAVEMVEFQGLTATPIRARQQDPGAITLTLMVPDLDAAKARLKGAKTETLSSDAREVVVRDPDGIFVKLAVGSAGGARFGVAVVDLDKTTRFFREALGFQVPSGAAATSDTAMRRATLLVPGSAFPVEFTEYKTKDRNPVRAAIHDPGASVLRLRVGDLDVTLKALKAEGAAVVSVGGEPVNLGRARAVILRESDNLFLQALEQAPAAGKGPAPAK